MSENGFGPDELVRTARMRKLGLPDADERIRIRESCKLSQRELGRALGVTWTTVQRWEQGATPRNLELGEQYAKLLKRLKALR